MWKLSRRKLKKTNNLTIQIIHKMVQARSSLRRVWEMNRTKLRASNLRLIKRRIVLSLSSSSTPTMTTRITPGHSFPYRARIMIDYGFHFLMNDLKNLISSIQHNVGDIVQGPLFNPKYETIKITFYAPDDARVDIAHYSLVAAYNVQKQKWKFTFLLKDAIPELIEEYVTAFEQIKAPLADRVLYMEREYDTFLLKCFQYFDRY